MDVASLRSHLRAEGRLILKVKVVPGSSRNEFAGVMSDGTIRVRVAAQPERGKANAELCAFLADELGVPKGSVRIERGVASPRKRILVLR